jgi:16S rRNA (adenine1518-N6/adenine1519-N6)-dimethyltransferase
LTIDYCFHLFVDSLPPYYYILFVFQPKKSLGQNFLTDPNIARKIVNAMAPAPDDVVVEIGPGKGILTELLLPSVRQVIAVDIDRRAIEYLQARLLGSGNLALLHADILDVDLEQLAAKYSAPLRIIGNIPYYITTPILFHMIDHRKALRDVQMMMQREVAQRLIAIPRTKQYGILSVMCRYVGTPEILFSVSPNAFYPKPRVFSAVIRLTFSHDERLSAEEERLFRTVVRGTFGKRRKTLRNGLKSLGVGEETLGQCTIDLDLRPETLAAADFLALARTLASSGTTLELPED